MAQNVVFQTELTTGEINAAVVRIHRTIQQTYPSIKRAFTQPVCHASRKRWLAD